MRGSCARPGGQGSPASERVVVVLTHGPSETQITGSVTPLTWYSCFRRQRHHFDFRNSSKKYLRCQILRMTRLCIAVSSV